MDFGSSASPIARIEPPPRIFVRELCPQAPDPSSQNGAQGSFSSSLGQIADPANAEFVKRRFRLFADAWDFAYLERSQGNATLDRAERTTRRLVWPDPTIFSQPGAKTQVLMSISGLFRSG